MVGTTEQGSYFEMGPVAVVVGCGDMGMATARALGRRHPLLVLDINAERLAERVAALNHEGFTASGTPLDITDEDAVKTFARSLEDGPGVKVLAHVAGVHASVGSWRKLMAVDLIGPHLVANAVAPHMVRGGAIIQIASLAGYLVPAGRDIEKLVDAPLSPSFFEDVIAYHGGEPDFSTAYAYAKLGIIRLSEALAVTLGSREIRAVTVTPGMINSSIGRTDGAAMPASDGSAGLISRAEKALEIPLRREGTIVEIVNAIDFIASDAASFINGVELLVDGGQRAGWRSRNFIAR